MSVKVRVLIVEDDEGVRKLFARYLGRENFEVFEAVDGESMLAILKKESIDLILLDYTLPGANAEHYIKELRDLEVEIPFIVVTGSGSEEIAVKMMKEGARDYLVKDQNVIHELASRVNKVWKDFCLEKQLAEVTENLEVKNAILSSVNELSLDAILVTGPKDTVLSYNQRFLKLWELEEELLGLHVDGLFLKLREHIQNFSEFLTCCVNVSSNMTPIDNLHDDIRLQDGKVLELYSSPMLSASSSFLGRIWYFRDVTLTREAEAEIKKARDEAEENTKAKAEFLAHFSHEVKNPMSNIMGFIDLMSVEPMSDLHTSCVESLKEGCSNLEKLIQSILDVSRLEAGAVKLSKELCDLRTSFEGVLNSFSWRMDDKLDLHLEMDFDDEFMMDLVLMTQVLTNLISNALKFTEEGSVTIVCRKDPDGLYIGVRDTGLGIEEGRQKAIFEAFEQETVLTARQHGGTGLGLAISAHLVRLMGGELRVESELTKGSEFYFTVPWK